METYITICKIGSRWELLHPAGSADNLCDNLEGWNGVGGGREVQEGQDISIRVAGSY